MVCFASLGKNFGNIVEKIPGWETFIFSLSCLAHGQAAQSSQEASGRLGLNRTSLQ